MQLSDESICFPVHDGWGVGPGDGDELGAGDGDELGPGVPCAGRTEMHHTEKAQINHIFPITRVAEARGTLF